VAREVSNVQESNMAETKEDNVSMVELVRVKVVYGDVPINPGDPVELVMRLVGSPGGQQYRVIAVDSEGRETVVWKTKSEQSASKKLVAEILKRGRIVEVGKCG